jgi:hypothetical protein
VAPSQLATGAVCLDNPSPAAIRQNHGRHVDR